MRFQPPQVFSLQALHSVSSKSSIVCLTPLICLEGSSVRMAVVTISCLRLVTALNSSIIRSNTSWCLNKEMNSVFQTLYLLASLQSIDSSTHELSKLRREEQQRKWIPFPPLLLLYNRGERNLSSPSDYICMSMRTSSKATREHSTSPI